MSFISELERLKEKATSGPLNERIVGLAMLGEFTVNHADEIAELVKAAQFTVLTGEGLTELDIAIANLKKEKS